ncbi:MAG: hypothetical protein KJ578_09380 [Bacteroidetes bacterium]|nr:hypothetical protein [Bacteroidota bacterium]MBU1579460.1 hypothetical protein [Bacteroidota bacterium]MBU2557974.1 hypothetical protein [Bacteroidota bacterium]
MSENPNAWYTRELLAVNTEIQSLSRKINRLSMLRISSFLLAVLFVVIFANSTQSYYIAAAITLFALFIYFTIRHIQSSSKLIRERTMARLIRHELGLERSQDGIYSDGKAFASQLPFADDLDLFGQHSLYQRINRCGTPVGEGLLAHGLINSLREPESIKMLQSSVKELSGFPEFRLQMQTHLLIAASEKFPDIERMRNTIPIRLFKGKIYTWMAFGLPAMVWLSLLAGLLGFGYTAFSILSVMALMLVFAQTRKVMILGSELDGLRKKFSTWAAVLQQFGQLELKSTMLVEMQQEANLAAARFCELATISEQFDRRANLLLYVLSNLFLAFDIHLALRYEKWREQNYLQIPHWITTLGRFEMLLSLSAFAWNHPDYVYPEISETPQLKAKALGHPLLPEEQCVKNDVHLSIDPRVTLITGSNMSGKSTWLRTLGVNVLLAQFGAPVMARSFSWKPMQLLSSLRQSDSLAENTSLFMNELKQLKSILEKAESTFSLILLDEILRGTNSDDKYTGSYELLKRLSKVNSLTVMASHDLKLSSLEQELEGSLINYCFESKIEKGKLLFDYTIRPGVAVNRNATWLMKDMGII